MKSKLLLPLLLCLIPTLSLGQGFDENYEVRKGDINGDGLTDLYIRQKPQIVILHGDIATPVVMPAPVDDFVLQQTETKEFNLLTGLSSEQKSQARQWPQASIEITTGDFNIDGAVDILLEGVSNVIAGVFDQLVFSSSEKRAAPQVVTALDQNVQKIFAEIGNALYDPNYFDNYAPIRQVVEHISEQRWFAEYCATYGWVSENGPLSQLPPIPTISMDTFDDLIDSNNAFIAGCLAAGRSVVHYDWVSVEYNTTANVKDYAVFSSVAVEISDILRTILENWQLEDGSPEKDVLKVLLEAIFKVPVFGPELDDDEELMTLSASIGYLSRRSKGAEAVSMGNCPKWENSFSTLPYATLKNTHSDGFIPNDTLIKRGRVSVTDNGQSAEITMEVYFGGTGAITSQIREGAERWSLCRTLPSGKTVRLKIIPDMAYVNEDVTVKEVNASELEADEICRDNAQRGGRLIKLCRGMKISINTRKDIAEHEFGHILGFPNVYNEKTGESLPGFEKDVMSATTGLNQIYPYHLELLLEAYK